MKNRRAASPEKWRSSRSRSKSKPDRKFRGRKEIDEEELDRTPLRVGMTPCREFLNGGVNINYLYRFLQRHVGEKWDDVRSELLKKVPTGIREYADIIGRLVAEKTEIIGTKIWDKKENEFLGFRNFKSFYVHPVSGTLKWVGRAKIFHSQTFTDK